MQPLAILDLNMVSALAGNAESNAALMRCGYSGSVFTEFYQSHNNQPQIGTPVNVVSGNARGIERLAVLSAFVLKDIILRKKIKDDVVLLVDFPEKRELLSEYTNKQLADVYLENMLQFLPIRRVHIGKSRCNYGARVSISSTIKTAHQLVYEEKHNHVLVVSVDSLLNLGRLRMLGGDRAGNGNRLIEENNSNGFIPGEAAVALLLGKPDGTEQTCITGIGFGEEPAPIYSGEILRANGLSEAIRNAAADAGIRVCDTDFRISSANGEEYWFKEASLAQSRTLEQKRESHPLWHPADHIGEVGATVGGAMVVMAHYAFEKGYAPGKRALCQLSNDDQHRAAFILERTGSS